MRGMIRTHVVGNREVDESGEVGCRDIYIGSLELVRSTSVTRADKDALDEGGAGEAPGEGVLAPAAADDEDTEGHGREREGGRAMFECVRGLCARDSRTNFGAPRTPSAHAVVN